MKSQNGFTLIELMIVLAILAIVAAIAIPSLLNARKSGNEASAISSLRTLSAVNEEYRTRFGSYSDSLANLSATGHIDEVLASGTKSGYTFTYAGAAATWMTSAGPQGAGLTGDRAFFVDQSGMIRCELSGTATSASSPLD